MSKPKCTPRRLRQTLEANLHHVQKDLQKADLTALARQSGFLKRLPRKIPVLELVMGLVALAAETVLSLERVAAVLALAAKTSYSKQAVHQRLGVKLELFLAQVAAVLFGQLSQPSQTRGFFAPFKRVLLHDSTVEALPEHLANVFAGASNGRKRRYAALKLQFVCDLLHSQVLQLSLSGFRRNDQAASPDILKVVKAGDLIIRDLGYFVLTVLDQIQLRGAHFLTRYRHGVVLYDPQSLQPLDLLTQLRSGQSLDRQVLVGKEHLPARLVALPVPEAVANERRRKARNNRDQRSAPSQRKLRLLSWNMFLTNVPRSAWPTGVLQPIYRLRWRIEIIFKAWKSHLRLRELNCRTADLLRLSVMTKLLFCIAVYRLCDALELMGDAQHHVSLLRLARILGQCACWFAATVLSLSLAQWIEWHLAHHLFYDHRSDRKNFYDLLAELCPA